MMLTYPKDCEAGGTHRFERLGYWDGYNIHRCVHCRKAYHEKVEFFSNTDMEAKKIWKSR